MNATNHSSKNGASKEVLASNQETCVQSTEEQKKILAQVTSNAASPDAPTVLDQELVERFRKQLLEEKETRSSKEDLLEKLAPATKTPAAIAAVTNAPVINPSLEAPTQAPQPKKPIKKAVSLQSNVVAETPATVIVKDFQPSKGPNLFNLPPTPAAPNAPSAQSAKFHPWKTALLQAPMRAKLLLAIALGIAFAVGVSSFNNTQAPAPAAESAPPVVTTAPNAPAPSTPLVAPTPIAVPSLSTPNLNEASAELAAAELVSLGQYAQALPHYQRLAVSQPNKPVFAAIVRILRRKLKDQCGGTNAVSPECQAQP